MDQTIGDWPYAYLSLHRKAIGAAQAGRAAMAIYEVADTLKDMPLLGRTGRKTGTGVHAGKSELFRYPFRIMLVRILPPGGATWLR